MAKKYYAVRCGRVPGIYETWDECKAQVDGYPAARYKSFQTKEQAKAFLEGTDDPAQSAKPKKTGASEKTSSSVNTESLSLPPHSAIAYVDGSFDVTKPTSFGYGVVFITNEGTTELSGCGTDAELAAMHNVAGEIRASMEAMKLAKEKGLTEITIYHDYEGIAAWPLRKWKANKEGTIAYRDYYDGVKSELKVSFIKVKGHSGDALNERADVLAKAGLLNEV